MKKKDLFNLEGKVVIITGGSGAIGGALSRGMAEAGCKVVVMGRNQSKIDKVVADVSAITDEVLGLRGDVMDKEDLHRCKQEILDRFGCIDVLINAAGGSTKGGAQTEEQTIFDLKIEDIDNIIALNLQGTIYPTLIFGESMTKSGKGSIINVSSMATYSALSRTMGYSVAKTGINSFTGWMACEMASKFGEGVRVNAIAPGFFIGEQNRALLINPDGSHTDRSKKVIAKTPFGRFGKVEELVGTVQFLSSDAAAFVTGVVIPVDGGFSAFSGV